jgi:hypothetical protein
MIVVLVKVLVSVMVGGIVMTAVMMSGPVDRYLTQQEIDEILNTQESK